MRHRRSTRLLLALCVLTIAGTAGLRLRPYRGYDGTEVIVAVPIGSSAPEVADLLASAGVVRSASGFLWIVRLTGAGTQLRAGEYRFSEPMSPMEVGRKLVDGDVLLRRVTVREGLRLAEILDALVEAGRLRRPELAAASRDVSSIRDLDADAEDLEGYLFPDTYQFAAGLSEAEVLGQMVVRFREVFGAAERARAAELGFKARDIVTLASLVEKETGAPAERPVISSVFHNRLERGMLLQCDPTVIYGLLREDAFQGRLTRSALQHDTPYNTYLHPGLPPGPIASPGADAIHAALNPNQTEYLYFVSMNDGTHHFSRSLREHQRAVERYQRSGTGR